MIPPSRHILSFAEYVAIRHATPDVVDVARGRSRLLLFGVRHSSDPADPMFDQIEAAFSKLAPAFALHEGRRHTRVIAIRRHGEAGLVRHLAARTGIDTASMDIPLAEEARLPRREVAPREALVFIHRCSHDRELERLAGPVAGHTLHGISLAQACPCRAGGADAARSEHAAAGLARRREVNMAPSATHRDAAEAANGQQALLPPLNLPRRMAATDAMFWYAESALPIFRPIIAGLYVLDRRPDPHRMMQGMEVGLALVPRLRQRVVEAPWHVGLPEWVDDQHFDVGYHVRHISLPPPGSQRELLDLAATLFATPLDRERPLWEAYWIDGLSGGRAAYFFKMHHSMVDGVGSITLVRGLTQRSRTGPMPGVAPAAAHPHRAPAGVLARLVGVAAENAAAAARMTWDATAAPLRILAHPADSAAQLQRTARGLRLTVADALAPPIVDPLAEACSGLSRRFDVMEIPLARLQRIKEPLGVTINDVVLAVLAGALGAYHRARHVHVDALNCMVPMNLRGNDERDTLGNRVGTFTVRLPLAERRARERLDLVTEQTRAAKSDRRGAAAPLVLQAIGLLPGFAFRWIARQSLGKINIACTNVPGVAEARYMAGARIEALYPFASVVEGTPVVVALLSYAGGMCVGIDTDPEAIPDPERLHALFDQGLADMERLAGVVRPRRHRSRPAQAARRRATRRTA